MWALYVPETVVLGVELGFGGGWMVIGGVKMWLDGVCVFREDRWFVRFL